MNIENAQKGYNYANVSPDFYGVKPHEKALKIADYEFFWDTVDELAPFGSEEGYISFMGLNEWLEENPGKPIIECLSWIFSIWELKLSDYNEDILENENIIKTIRLF